MAEAKRVRGQLADIKAKATQLPENMTPVYLRSHQDLMQALKQVSDDNILVNMKGGFELSERHPEAYFRESHFQKKGEAIFVRSCYGTWNWRYRPSTIKRDCSEWSLYSAQEAFW